MAVNKVIYNGETLIDTTGVSVAPETLVTGSTALNAAGELIDGSNPYEKTATDAEVNTQADLIQQVKTVLRTKSAGGSEDLDAVLTEQEALIAGLKTILKSKAAGGSGSCAFEWANVYEIEIGANSIKNSTDTVAYIKTLVDSYSTSLILLMSPLTVNNQLVLCGATGVTRWRGGKIANTTVGTNYDMFIPEGTKYLVLEYQG